MEDSNLLGVLGPGYPHTVDTTSYGDSPLAPVSNHEGDFQHALPATLLMTF